MDDSTIICACAGITKGDVVQAIKDQKLTTLEDVSNATNAGSFCGQCQDDIQAVLDEVNG